MIKKLVATGVVFGLGYIVGLTFGFRAAVVDYVENGAQSIEQVAEDIYPDVEEGGQEVPDMIREALEQADDDTDDRERAFQ